MVKLQQVEGYSPVIQNRTQTNNTTGTICTPEILWYFHNRLKSQC